jgi:lipopolysaccharide export system protein LptC
VSSIAPARADHRPAAVAPVRGWHSRIVDLLRYLLPATALMLIGLVIAWPQFMGSTSGLIAPMFVPSQVDGSDVMMMHSPRYVGQTKKAEPYEVTANSAYLDPARPERIHLDHLAADLDAAGERDLRLTAISGIYDRDAENLDLGGGIELITSDGYRFETESAWLDLAQGRVVGGQPIAGRGPSGTLSADHFEILDAGHILQFKGRVKVTLFPRSPEDARS